MRKALTDSPTKQRLLDTAQRCVLENGFSATSVDEICKDAKLTKGSFFHYFKSKDALGAELLRRYCENGKQMFKGGCCSQEKDPLKRVYGFLDFMIVLARKKDGKGCLLGSMAQELSDTHPEIRAICAAGFAGMAEILKKDLAEAKSKHAPKASFSPREVADHFVAVLEGSMLLARVRKDAGFKENGLKHFKAYVQSLFMK